MAPPLGHEVGFLFSPLVHLSVLVFSCFGHLIPSKYRPPLHRMYIPHARSSLGWDSALYPYSDVPLGVIPTNGGNSLKLRSPRTGGYPWRRNRCYRRNPRPVPCGPSCRLGCPGQWWMGKPLGVAQDWEAETLKWGVNLRWLWDDLDKV